MIRLHLASKSPRRRQLLQEAGIPFDVVHADVDEALASHVSPEEAVESLAIAKARAGTMSVADGWVLGADTIVVLDSRILGKPVDRNAAREMISSLSGREHRVLTGVALVAAGGDRTVCEHACTRVFMRALSETEVEGYVASGECDDKAGAYAIQGAAAAFVERIEGSWTNVVGLPMELLGEMLSRLESS